MKFQLGTISEVVSLVKGLSRTSTIKDTKTVKRLPSRTERVLKRKDPVELNVLQLTLERAEVQN